MPPALHLFHSFFLPDHHQPSPWDRRFGCIATLLRIFDNHRPPHLLRRHRRRRRRPDLDADPPPSSELHYSKSASANAIDQDSRRRHAVDLSGRENNNNTAGDGDDFNNYPFDVDDNYHSGAALDYCSRSTPGSPRRLRSYISCRATADRQLWPNHNNDGSGGMMMRMEPVDDDDDDDGDDLRIIDVVPARASVDGVPASYFRDMHHNPPPRALTSTSSEDYKGALRRDRSDRMILPQAQESLTAGQHLRCRTTSKASTDVRQQRSVAGHENVRRNNRAPSDRREQMDVDTIFGEPRTKESAGARRREAAGGSQWRTPKLSKQQQQTLQEKLSTTTRNNHGAAPVDYCDMDDPLQKLKDSARALAKLQLMTQDVTENLRRARHSRRQQQLPSFTSSNVDGSSLIGSRLCKDAGDDGKSYSVRMRSTAGGGCRRSEKPTAAAVVDDHDDAGAELINALLIKDREQPLFHSARHDHAKLIGSSSSTTAAASAIAPQRNSSFDYSEAARVSQRMQELDVSAPRRSLDGGSTAAEHRHRSSSSGGGGAVSKSVLRLREAVLSRFFTAHNRNNSSSASVHQDEDDDMHEDDHNHPLPEAAAAGNLEHRRNLVPSATKPAPNVIARLMGLDFEQPKIINRGTSAAPSGDVKNYNNYTDGIAAKVPPKATAGRRLVPAPDFCRNQLQPRYGVTSNVEKTHAAAAVTEDSADIAADRILNKSATCKSISSRQHHHYITNDSSEATCKSIIRQQQHDRAIIGNGDTGFLRQNIRLTPWRGGRRTDGRNLSTETLFSPDDTATETASGDEVAVKSMSFRQTAPEITDHDAASQQSTTQMADILLCADKHFRNYYGKRPKYRRSCENAAGDTTTKSNGIDGSDQDQLPILPSTDYNYIVHRPPESRRRKKAPPAIRSSTTNFSSSVTRNNERSAAAVSAEAIPSPRPVIVDQHRLSKQLVSAAAAAAELDHDGGSSRSRKSRSLPNNTKKEIDGSLIHGGSSPYDRRRRSSGAQTIQQNRDDYLRYGKIDFGREACQSDKHRRRLMNSKMIMMNRTPEIVFDDVQAEAEEVNPKGNYDRFSNRSAVATQGYGVFCQSVDKSNSAASADVQGEEKIRRTETVGTEENESPVSVLEADRRNYHLYDNVSSSSASTHSDSCSVITDEKPDLDSEAPPIRLITLKQLRHFLAAILPRLVSHPLTGPHVGGGSVDYISGRFSAEIPSPAGVSPAALRTNEGDIHIRSLLPDSFRSLHVNYNLDAAGSSPSSDSRLISDIAADMVGGIETWLLGHALYAPMFARYHSRLIGSPADILHQIRSHPSSSSSGDRHVEASSATGPDRDEELELEEWDGIMNGRCGGDAISVQIDGHVDGVEVVVSAKGLMAAVWRRLQEAGSAGGVPEWSAGNFYEEEGEGKPANKVSAMAVVRNGRMGNGRKVVKVEWGSEEGVDEVLNLMKEQMAAAEMQGRAAAAAAAAAEGLRGGGAASCYGGLSTYLSVALAVENSVIDDLLLDLVI